MNEYWDSLSTPRKRLALLWLYIIKTQSLDRIKSDFAEPLWIDQDQVIKPHLIPRVFYMMNPNQLLREIDKTGGHPSWIQD
jgi:hypothetical protein